MHPSADPEKRMRLMISPRREFLLRLPADADLAAEAARWPGVYRIEDVFGNTLWKGPRP